MFIYSGQWQESQVFHRYVQRDITRSQLLHKARSAGQSKKEWRSEGRTYTVHWAQPHLFYPLAKKRRWRSGQGRREFIFKYKRTCTNRPSRQALCSHIYSCRNRQPRRFHGRTIHLRYARYKEKQSQRYGKGLIKTGGVWERRGEGAGPVDTRMEWEINHCRQVHNQVLAIGAHSLTHCESSGTVPLSKTNASHTQMTLKGLHVRREHLPPEQHHMAGIFARNFVV